jgi:MFS transporter, DHA1 family, inner membrane transport protein
VSEPTTSPRLALLTAIRLVGNGAFRFLYPFLPLVARSLGVPTARAGLLVSAVAVGGISTPLVRRLVTRDRERTRHLLVTSAALLAVGTAVAAGAPGLLVALVGFLLLGVSKPLIDVATITYAADRTPYTRRARVTGIMEVTWAGALIVIAPLAGVVAARTSWRVPLVGLGLLALLGGLVARVLLDPDPEETAAARPDRDRLPASAWRFLGVVGLAFAALEATFSVFGLWLDDVFGASTRQLGTLAAVTALGELMGSVAVLTLADRVGKARAAFVGLGVCALGLLALSTVAALPLAVATLAVGLFGSETAIVATITMATEVVPGARSRFLAAMVAAGSVSRALAAGLGPALYDAVGIRGNVTVSVVAAVGGAVLLRWTLRHDPRLAA